MYEVEHQPDCSKGSVLQLARHVDRRELGAPTVGMPAFFRMADVIRITALSRATVYRRNAGGKFPHRSI
jgi:prophage regulatory protein